jgi:uncharacterized membrane protein YtjA (UPF0391 family)
VTPLNWLSFCSNLGEISILNLWGSATLMLYSSVAFLILALIASLFAFGVIVIPDPQLARHAFYLLLTLGLFTFVMHSRPESEDADVY